VVLAGGLFVLSPAPSEAGEKGASIVPPVVEKTLMGRVEKGQDHIEPEDIADRLMAGEPDLVIVDVRPAAEFKEFHIRGAINVPLAELAETLKHRKNKGQIVLYSNGMTHPAQARDSLQRQGFTNVYLLTDGLRGFKDRCLKPVSLRTEPLSMADAARVNAWRAFFTGPAISKSDVATAPVHVAMPRAVETHSLASMIGTPGLKIIDLRPQPEYNTAHIPGSLSVNLESFRGNIGGVPSMLLPPAMLAAQFSLLGLKGTDSIVLVSGDKLYDTTLAAMAFERLGHLNYAVMNGGYAKWAQESRPSERGVARRNRIEIPRGQGDADDFTVDFQTGAQPNLASRASVVIDVRPVGLLFGQKDPTRPVPAIFPARSVAPFTEDLVITSPDKVVSFKATAGLGRSLQPDHPFAKDTLKSSCTAVQVIRPARPTLYLKRLLGYANVRWYDAGWTEWAARAGTSDRERNAGHQEQAMKCITENAFCCWETLRGLCYGSPCAAPTACEARPAEKQTARAEERVHSGFGAYSPGCDAPAPE
jgi:3-mercaptopyruvate sulfurtransferase SseA